MDIFKKVYQNGKEFIQKVMEEDIFSLSAQISYYLILSLFPFLMFTVTLLGFLPIRTDDVLSLLEGVAPEESLKIIEPNLHSVFETKRSGLLSITIIATIWSASNGINAIIRSLNKAYDVTENRTFIKTRGNAIILTIIMIFIIVLALVLPVFGDWIAHFIFVTLNVSSTLVPIWTLIRWLASFCVLYFAFLLIYVWSPNMKLHFQDVGTGALFAASGWLLVSYLFSYFVNHFGNYSATYGSLAGVIVLMLWFYISGMILIVGGILNAFLMKKRKEKEALEEAK
ncbi:YihY/virulence factor BrkB family protein [Massilibacterium senegalense]|uniref:YihY/virulence factor BrkB family protein n=1 Tax=Massilibacterium senegalense TaxID=1632858 RepID=UPI0007840244|nr:YihY/virulence factor BrkB family protein [Massilibacterium senegalense]